MKKILFIAGEASGDKHGAELIKALKKNLIRDVSIEFVGIGGALMQSQGLRLLEHNKNMSFLGLWEVIKHLGYIKQKLKQMKDFIINDKPDLVVLIDYPGFNMKIAVFAKKAGIPVIYYILPKVWAWGKNRVKKIKKNIDLPLSILPFEKEFYKKHNFDIEYVGNPSLETIKNEFSKEEFIKKYQLDPDKKIIGLLPGSRKMEIESLLPVMLESVKILIETHNNLQFVMSQAGNLENALYYDILKEYDLPVVKVKGYPYDIMKHSHLTMVASGTASLETAIFGTPSVVLYKVNPLTYWIGKKVVNVSWLSLTNLILEKEIFPEFIQDNCEPQKIYKTIDSWLNSDAKYNEVIDSISPIPSILGNAQASENAAKHIYALLK
ncbi:MAG: lipid-A-disaccharide synthase [Calditrichia bacterium]|nr:lipid-A-disaccharide synthase [Calditrichia bacterium]